MILKLILFRMRRLNTSCIQSKGNPKERKTMRVLLCLAISSRRDPLLIMSSKSSLLVSWVPFTLFHPPLSSPLDSLLGIQSIYCICWASISISSSRNTRDPLFTISNSSLCIRCCLSPEVRSSPPSPYCRQIDALVHGAIWTSPASHSSHPKYGNFHPNCVTLILFSWKQDLTVKGNLFSIFSKLLARFESHPPVSLNPLLSLLQLLEVLLRSYLQIADSYSKSNSPSAIGGVSFEGFIAYLTPVMKIACTACDILVRNYPPIARWIAHISLLVQLSPPPTTVMGSAIVLLLQVIIYLLCLLLTRLRLWIQLRWLASNPIDLSSLRHLVGESLKFLTHPITEWISPSRSTSPSCS